MKLHVFNPEHDIALGTLVRQFTPPHAARQLRADLSFLPALWASDGDLVLTDNVDEAREGAGGLRAFAHNVTFITPDDLRTLQADSLGVSVWGWDTAVCRQLCKYNPALQAVLPDSERLTTIREMSHRRFAATRLLEPLVRLDPKLTGAACYISQAAALDALPPTPCVLKAPWSSSGRGIRYMDDRHRPQIIRWAHNVLTRQGGIMIEPLYNKVCDFGMEFTVRADGRVTYDGLSLFKTLHGAYTGNLIATESCKRALLSRYIPLQLLDTVKESILQLMQPLTAHRYSGPFGVDMMIVTREDGRGWYLHPCVELNLRRTMGHVALALQHDDAQPQRIMHITCTDKYRFNVVETREDIINNGLIGG